MHREWAAAVALFTAVERGNGVSETSEYPIGDVAYTNTSGGHEMILASAANTATVDIDELEGVRTKWVIYAAGGDSAAVSDG